MAQKTKKAKRGAAAAPTVDQACFLAPLVPRRSLQSLSQPHVGHASPSLHDSHACQQQRTINSLHRCLLGTHRLPY